MTEKARKAEAANENTTVLEFRGDTFTVDRHYEDWTVDFLESLEEGKAVGIVRGALGPAQWRRVRSMDLKVKDLNELAAKIASAMGFDSTGE